MKASLLERVLVAILLVVAGGIVLHAPLTVWLGTTWPDATNYIKAWKELLMGAGLVLLIATAVRRQKVDELLGDRLLQLSLVYAGLHFVLIGLLQNDLAAAGAGLLIDLRYVLYFVLVYAALRLLPQYRRLFLNVFVGGAAVVIGFALLQIFVLPRDILSHIGYSKQTIAPYLTVDENPAFVRINSTLRGPNPLGAYAVTALSLIAAVALRWKLGAKGWWLVAGGGVAALVTLWASHSRSSMIAAVLALGIVGIVSVPKKHRMNVATTLALAAVVFAVTVVAFRDTSLVKNVVFHDNPATGAAVDSNAGHAESLIDGAQRIIRQPLGGGVGSTGSASLETKQPLIIENQYLFTAHEAGWIGLVLFVWLFVEIMRRLWARRQSTLALGIFASGCGLALIGILLPVWVDDTVSIVWWGLAAVAVAGNVEARRKRHGTRKSN